MATVTYLKARQILDSRGTPTVEADMRLDNGNICRASVPSGASTGSYESVELRDKDKNKFNGKGVLKAIENINSIISKEIKNKEFQTINEFDSFLINLDGTDNKSKIGANAILACSMAFMKCSASNMNKEIYEFLNPDGPYLLPTPLMNIINGGAHANNGLDIQEFMIVPAGFDTFSESLRAGVEIFMSLKQILEKKNYSTAVGDEGGFAPDLKSNQDALELISISIKDAGYKLGEEVYLALDVAASEICTNKKYKIDGNLLLPDELIEYYKNLCKKYPIISIEDPIHEDDWSNWSNLTSQIGDHVQIVGDDLFVTNEARLNRGIEEKAGNSILVKINQIGSISETIDTINLANSNNFSYIVSHRSGETEDSTISDIAVGTNSGQIKTGSCSRTDRTSKYNQLIRIEEFLGDKAGFAKLSTFHQKL
ncbi:MAG: phosphopyruvate hydratase [Thermodesulfobacteriota bacterium]|nr:phosphopyruvate hydratase [Thermodesulfobacteriota bacterium]